MKARDRWLIAEVLERCAATGGYTAKPARILRELASAVLSGSTAMERLLAAAIQIVDYEADESDQAYLAACAKDCSCTHGICGGVLVGGFCDELVENEHYEGDDEFDECDDEFDECDDEVAS